MEQEKTLTLKSLKKETDTKLAKMRDEIEKLSKEVEILKKVLTR